MTILYTKMCKHPEAPTPDLKLLQSHVSAAA